MNTHYRVGRADALYFAIAITVTIVELAVIATSPGLGELALEYAFVAQLVISILVEFITGYLLISRLGIIYSTYIGFWLKTASCCFFFSGAAIVAHSFLYSWLLIIFSFVLDAMGTGLLKAAFRPAYSAMQYTHIGKPADYLNSLRGFTVLRIGLPCFLLFWMSILNIFVDDHMFIGLIFFIVFVCRCAQGVLAHNDLREAKFEFTNTSNLRWYTPASFFVAFKNSPSFLIFYVTGTIFESLILMYGVGLIYKHKGIIAIPDALTWMGASAISIFIYMISFAGAGYLVGRWPQVQGSKYFLVSFLCLTGVVVGLLMLTPGEPEYFIGLIGFCFLASVSAMLLIRHASTQLLVHFSEQESAHIFLWAELTANALLVLIVAAATMFTGAEGVVRVFALLFGVSIVLAKVFFSKKMYSRIR